MPRQQIKTEPNRNQNDDSYQQQIFENEKTSSPQNQPQPQMLDQNQEFEIYDQSPSDLMQHNPTSSLTTQSKLENVHINDDRESSSIDFAISTDIKNIKNEAEQPDTDLDDETSKVSQFLLQKYSRFDQEVLIQMLYDKCFPKNIKAQSIEGTNAKNNFDNLKKMTKVAQIYVDHGYGINIARKYAQKGQEINPNPYNNMICKIIKDTWKGVQKEIQKIRGSLRHLNTEQFNQVKTPLINARQWMAKQYLDIFLNIVAYVNGVRPFKPSANHFEKFYDFFIPKAKGRKQNDGRRSKSRKSKKEKSRYEDSSDEFKVPKHQERKIVYGKPSKYHSKKQYDDD